MTAPALADQVTTGEGIPTAADVLAVYRGRPRALKNGSRAFFDAREVKAFAERAEATGEFRRMIFPPLDLSGEAGVGVVSLVWIGNPHNEALRHKIGNDSLLAIGYQIYRWTQGSRPQVIARTSLQETTFSDETVGPARGEYYYSVLTVLEGRVGGMPTVIESERSNVLRVETKEAYTLEVLRRVGDGVQVAISLAEEERSERHEFLVRVGEEIGAVAELGPGRSRSFATGLKLTNVQEVEEEKEVDVARALFEPDGRRSLDSEGRPAFERGKRVVKMRHVEISATTTLGERRTYSSQAVPAE
jgi:hypothetical protein